MVVDALAGPEPSHDSFTSGSWLTEAASASALDHRIEATGMFHIYREVVGTLTQPRPGQRDRAMRIDRVLTPTPDLRAQGWEHGAIGIEIKRSGESIGPPLAQAMDYVRGSWRINGVWFQLGAVFLWPMHKQSGPLASLMVHNRIGSASSEGHDKLKLSLGEEVIFADGFTGIRLGRVKSGERVGSR
jgi:hypothetical protein